jgi:hypothetical protein
MFPGILNFASKYYMKEFIKKHIIEIIFALAGSAGGFLYWKFVGCTSGTCMIKSVWYMSTLYGLVLGWVTGGLASDVVLKFRKTKKDESQI